MPTYILYTHDVYRLLLYIDSTHVQMFSGSNSTEKKNVYINLDRYRQTTHTIIVRPGIQKTLKTYIYQPRNELKFKKKK